MTCTPPTPPLYLPSPPLPTSLPPPLAPRLLPLQSPTPQSLHLSGTHPLGSLTPRWTSTGPPTPCARQEPSRSDPHRAARPRELKAPTPAASRCHGAGSGRQAKPHLYHPGLKTRESAGALYFTHRLRALDGTGEQERGTPRHRG